MYWLRAFVMGLICASTAAADWPQWLGPNRDGSTSAKVPAWKGNLNMLWKRSADSGHSSPIVVGDRLYLHSQFENKNQEMLSAVDAETGKLLETAKYPRAFHFNPFGLGPRGTPAYADGKIYTLGITGILTCFDAKTLKQVWQVDTVKQYKASVPMFGISGSPLVDGDHVFVNVGAKGAGVVAFHKDTGKEVWKQLDDGVSYSSPILRGKGELKQVIFLTAQGLVGLSAKDGSVFWQQPFKDKIAESSTTPTIIHDKLFGSSVTLGSIAMQFEDKQAIPRAKELWRKPEITCYFSTPIAVGKDHLYLVTGKASLTSAEAKLHCVDVNTGKVAWTRADKVGSYHASLTRTGDGKLLLLEEAGDLVLMDADSTKYSELARSKLCGETWAHPAIANGRLYIRDKSSLYCFELPK